MKSIFLLTACATATYAASIAPLDDVKDDAPCYKQTPGCPVARCFGPAPPGCSLSTKLISRGGKFCCPEMCVYRKDTASGRGSGDICYARPMTVTARSTPAPLAACPQQCKDIYEGYRAKGYSDKACIDLAKNGFMCTNADGNKVRCDAEAAGFVKGHTDCVGGKEFIECGSPCPLTCNNIDEDMICMEMCVTGCFCTGKTAIWDEASEQCMDETACPGDNQCESTIGENYLNTGNLQTECKGTEDDDACYSPGCVDALCVPDGDWDEGSKMYKICGRDKTEKACTTGNAKGAKKRCKWAEGTDAGQPPPVFLCSDGEWVLGKGQCSFDEPPGVTTIPPNVEAACDFIEESGCYQTGYKPVCDITTRPECYGIVKTAYSNCKATCLTFNAASTNPKCGECVEDALFQTRTIDESRPDIYTCCNCLDAAFEKIGVSSSELDRMLQLTCPISAGYGDDAFDDDDQD